MCSYHLIFQVKQWKCRQVKWLPQSFLARTRTYVSLQLQLCIEQMEARPASVHWGHRGRAILIVTVLACRVETKWNEGSTKLQWRPKWVQQPCLSGWTSSNWYMVMWEYLISFCCCSFKDHVETHFLYLHLHYFLLVLMSIFCLLHDGGFSSFSLFCFQCLKVRNYFTIFLWRLRLTLQISKPVGCYFYSTITNVNEYGACIIS